MPGTKTQVIAWIMPQFNFIFGFSGQTFACQKLAFYF
jgi:hypothetical protein